MLCCVGSAHYVADLDALAVSVTKRMSGLKDRHVDVNLENTGFDCEALLLLFR